MVIWTNSAREDLKNLYDYIFRDSPVYARLVLDAIMNKVGLLVSFPALGRIVPERDSSSIRELIVYSYRIIYAHRDNDIYIVAIVHGKQNYIPAADRVTETAAVYCSAV